MKTLTGIMAVTIFLIVTGANLIGERNVKNATAPSSEDGVSLYKRHCLSCHQADGSGVPSLYPGLNGNERVVGEAKPLIEVILLGSKGPFSVDKDKYMGAMASYKFLSDEDIANVLTYIRTHFTNDAGTISAGQVKEVRSSIE
ncbi:MAG TPA: cytochrome c [Bacteroidales bacterium]|nr:cytochrome c [Bacteroidales bacterium]